MPKTSTLRRYLCAAPVIGSGFALLACASTTSADVAVPAYSSRPGAAYTIYLDFGGFSFTGGWGNGSGTPGVTPAYDDNSNAAAFSSTELANIENIWSRVSQKYSPFNVNVTTVDPAVAANAASTDLSRQNYYDSQARLMHTVIGGNGTWSNGGGVSYIGVTPTSQSGSNGYHTNFVFSNEAPDQVQFVADGSAHENGHGFGLNHQSDYTGSTLVNEYSSGTGTGTGTVAPIMGDSYYAGRGLFATGTSDTGGTNTIQNDVKIIANDPGMGGFINDGIGHTLATATALAHNGNAIDFNTDKGVIVPASSSAPVAAGSANYQPDYWSFTTAGGLISLTANSGEEFITAGTPDPGATLNATLGIYNSAGTLIAQSATSSLSESISATLAAGSYYAEVTAAGDAIDTSSNNRTFFDEGAFFLSGTIPAVVPEPATIGVMVISACLMVRRRSATRLA